jgi:hypothetical protein
MMDTTALARPNHAIKDWPLNCCIRGMALDKSQPRLMSGMDKTFENELPLGDFVVKANSLVLMPSSTHNSLKIDIWTHP